MPANISFVQAAAIPLTALTALQALRDKANLKQGHHVMINGASGGVGSFAVQIAKTLGAHVTAVSSGRNRDFVGSLGADAFVNYEVEDITNGSTRYDVLFDAVNTFPWRKGKQVLRRNGTFVSVNPILALPPLRLVAWANGWRLRSLFVKPSGADLETMCRWIEEEHVQVAVEQHYSLAHAVEAHRRSETQRVRGKLVIVINEQLASSRASAG
jgi:NADPH:quinone reductase-like Zn-dependent oxidoreductase